MKRTTILKQVTLLGALCFGLCANAQDVYVAGYYNDGSASNMAAIWEEDGTRSDLTNGNNAANAKDIFTYNGDVYAVGFLNNGTNNVAKIWKNGTAQNLTNSSTSAIAESIFVSNGDVYVAGSGYNGTKYVAKLWKNGNVQNLTDGSENAQAQSVFVSSGDVYVVGTEYDYSVDGNYVDAVIKIWKNGTAQDLTNGINYAYAESIFIDNGDVYVAGRESNGTNYIAKLWKNGNAVNLTDGSSRASANSVFVNNGDVYVAGYDGTQPRLWKNGVQETLNYNGNLDGGKAYSVYVSGSDVYVSGTLTESNNSDVCHYGTLWKNGQFDFKDAAPLCTDDTAMYSVFVDDSQLSTETLVNPKNSFSLYPNPTSDLLHLETTADNIQEITLISITGKHLKTWKEQTEIDLSSFATGTYFVKIATKEGLYEVKQIIKE